MIFLLVNSSRKSEIVAPLLLEQKIYTGFIFTECLLCPLKQTSNDICPILRANREVGGCGW